MNGPAQHGHDGERKRQNDKGDFSGVHWSVNSVNRRTRRRKHDQHLQLVGHEEDVHQGQVEHRRLKQAAGLNTRLDAGEQNTEV